MKRMKLLFILVSMIIVAVGCDSGQPGSEQPRSAQPPTAQPRTVQTETQIFTLEEVYKSMFGPRDHDRLVLLETPEPEVLWVTAISAQMVGADGQAPQSPEFFCHSALNRVVSQPKVRAELLGGRLGRARKMFTLVQGLTEIRFPDGFGMPVLSNDEFVSSVMVMNPIERENAIQVGVDSHIEYVRESDAPGQTRPLFLVPLVTKVPVEGNAYHSASDVSGHDETSSIGTGDHQAHHGPGEVPHDGDGDSCLSHDEETTVARSVDRTGTGTGTPLTLGGEGVEKTGHWYVPPGRHTYRHRIGPLTGVLPFDTRAHYISAHLHPFGESLELIDVTTGESVFKAESRNFENRIAVEEITHYSSEEGLLIRRDHEYEIVAIYDNTTDGEVDSMAVMYLYLADGNTMSPAQGDH